MKRIVMPSTATVPTAAAADKYLGASSGAGPFTTTTTVTADGLAHLVTITSGANLSAITFTVAGTDHDGRTLTEAITGPNNTTVTGSSFFKTVTGVTVSGTTGASTFTVGNSVICVTPSVILDLNKNPFQVGIGVDVTGTISCKIQHTFDDMFSTTTGQTWFDHPALTGMTADTDGNYAFPVSAVRLYYTSGTGSAKATIIQAGIN